ncbi:MAG TPA: transporter substrate-binding domain-containing protein [Janthinobacterium sp.]|nr:transporter substrate-binding domain-containing protein [Janthinobacterium sp.]
MAPSSMLVGDEVVGRETEKIRQIMERTGIAYKIDLLPWKRAYMLAEQGNNTCVYATSRTPEREKLFKWVGPLEEIDWILIGRPDGTIKLKTLEDARNLRIGTYNGDVREEYLRAHGFHVQSVPNDAYNPQKLLMGRIDVWTVAVPVGSALLSQWEWAGKLVPLLTFHNIKAYLACNPSVPDELVERMNAALADMRRAGEMIRLGRKYEHWDYKKQ